MTSLHGHAQQPGSKALQAMTFNIRYPSNEDGADQWAFRKSCVAELLQQRAPDIIALQEAFKLQVDGLAMQLPGYAWVGRSRYGNASNEYTAIFFNRARFTVLDHGDFWLSDTPEQAGSITWGHPLPRMVTWAKLREVATGRDLHVFNTHFPWRSEDADARLRSARLIRSRIETMAGDSAVVLLGDFNTTDDTAAHAVFAGLMQDAWQRAPLRRGPEGTWHAFKGVPQMRIDWIWSRGATAIEAETIDARCPNGRYPSDHFPVHARMRWP